MPEDRKGCCGSYCDSFSEYVALLQQPTRSLSVKQYVALDFSKDAGKTPPDEAALLAFYGPGNGRFIGDRFTQMVVCAI